MEVGLPLLAGTISTVIFAGSMKPMMVKAARTGPGHDGADAGLVPALPPSTPARLHENAQITLAAPQAMVGPTDIIFAWIGPG
jgi:hypothetical protein